MICTMADGVQEEFAQICSHPEPDRLPAFERAARKAAAAELEDEVPLPVAAGLGAIPY